MHTEIGPANAASPNDMFASVQAEGRQMCSRHSMPCSLEGFVAPTTVSQKMQARGIVV